MILIKLVLDFFILFFFLFLVFRFHCQNKTNLVWKSFSLSYMGKTRRIPFIAIGSRGASCHRVITVRLVLTNVHTPKKSCSEPGLKTNINPPLAMGKLNG